MFAATIIAQLVLSTLALVGGCLYLRYYVTRDENETPLPEAQEQAHPTKLSSSNRSDSKTSAAA